MNPPVCCARLRLTFRVLPEYESPASYIQPRRSYVTDGRLNIARPALPFSGLTSTTKRLAEEEMSSLGECTCRFCSTKAWYALLTAPNCAVHSQVRRPPILGRATQTPDAPYNQAFKTERARFSHCPLSVVPSCLCNDCCSMNPSRTLYSSDEAPCLCLLLVDRSTHQGWSTTVTGSPLAHRASALSDHPASTGP